MHLCIYVPNDEDVQIQVISTLPKNIFESAALAKQKAFAKPDEAEETQPSAANAAHHAPYAAIRSVAHKPAKYLRNWYAIAM